MKRLVQVGIIGTFVLTSFAGGRAHAATDDPGGVSDGLVLWLDASDPNGDGSVPTEGADVDTWVDLSSLHNDAHVNTRNTNYPATYVGSLAAVNNRPALRFTRGADLFGSVYEVANLDIRASVMPDLTVFTVYLPVVVIEHNGIWGNDDSGWDRFFLSYHDSFGDGLHDGLVSLGPTLAGETIPGAATTDAAHLMTVGYDGYVNGANENVGVPNGSYVYFDCAKQRTFTDSSNATDAQATFSIGWDGDNSAYDGYVSELIVYNRALTDSELEDVYTYLSTKYQLGADCERFITRDVTTTTQVAVTTEVLANTGDSSRIWLVLTTLVLFIGIAMLSASCRRVSR